MAEKQTVAKVDQPVISIQDIWETSWNGPKDGKLFQRLVQSAPLIFSSAKTGNTEATISVDEKTTFQTISGIGATLTDTSALVLDDLKRKKQEKYWELIKVMFAGTYAARNAGFSWLRVPIGASDFSETAYSLHDDGPDPLLHKFSVDRSPAYLFSTIKDILSVNSRVKVQLVPWSPPWWMKDNKDRNKNGGNFKEEHQQTYALYLLKAVQGFVAKNIPVYAISIQNEPENSNSTYPTCKITPQIEGQIGKILRGLLDSHNLKGVKLIGFEHNFGSAGGHPLSLINQAGSAFEGVSFHGYAGKFTDMKLFTVKQPQKSIYMTELTGMNGTDFWDDIKWWTDNLYVGSIDLGVKCVAMWLFAARPDGGPRLPGTSSCGGKGCRPVVSISEDGNYSLNQEFYAMAHNSQASFPKDADGPYGKRIKYNVSGDMHWALKVSAYVTERSSSAEWKKYTLVVLNWRDHDNQGKFSPQPVQTTIAFRGLQVAYTFPVGLTTLWWYAPA